MKILQRIPLNFKLFFIVAVPVAAMVYFANNIISSENGKIKYFESINAEINDIAYYIYLAEELQNERSLSFSRLVNKNEESKNKLHYQRLNTNLALGAVNEDKKSSFWSSTMLQYLEKRRLKIDSLLFQPFESNEYFTEVILKIYGQIPQIDSINNPAVLASGLNTQYHLGKASTYFSLIRARIFYGLVNGSLTPGEFGTLRNFHLIFNTALFDYKKSASPSQILEFQKMLSDDALQETLQHFELVLNKGKMTNGISPEDWWELSTLSVKMINQLRNDQLEHLKEEAEKLLHSKKNARDLKILMLIFLLVITIVLVGLNIQSISEAILKIELAVNKLANGNTDIQLDIATRDVIGKLSESIIFAAQANQKIAETALIIGKGNFDVEVPVRSEVDSLGIAVTQMKNELAQLNLEKNNLLWIQKGALAISEKLSGEQNINNLSKVFLDSLVTYSNAQIAAFYVHENDSTFCLAASYAVNEADLKFKYKMGEGLVGEAALSGAPIVLKDLPPDYFKINSTFGNFVPKNLLIFPFKFQNKVLGIIEIGTINHFSDREIELIEELEKTVGAAISSACYHLKLENLLQQTQAQAEELQAQQEDLLSVNSELEMQTHRLQASEEELRVQQEEILAANKILEERSLEMEEKNLDLRRFAEEIDHKNEELKQASQYKSEFLANMSHELRTPLNSILLLSKLLSEKQDGNNSKECKEYAEVIQQSGKGLLDLINEILDLSKIEAGKMELEIEEVSVKEITGEVQTLFAQIAQQKNILFNIEIDSNVPATITTDKGKVGQVLKNLISNALKFTEKGTVQIEIKKTESDRLNFIVKDTGIGIKKDQLNLIFEAFQQGDSSSRRKYGGTGLGLSISKELAHMLGGFISLTSKAGAGSTFTFTIPIKANISSNNKTDNKKHPEKSGIQLRSESKKTVLAKAAKRAEVDEKIMDIANEILHHKKVIIVDDDIRNIFSLTQVLENQKMKVLAAGDGREALSLLEKNPDTAIVLMDVMMPDMDGYEAMTEIRKRAEFSALPIISVTAKAMKGDREKCLQAGASDYISKPVDALQLLSLLKVWLYKP
jgi:signal transduction histidine kinase